MRTRALALLLIGSLAALMAPAMVAAQDESPAATEAADETSLLFVATAASGSSSGSTLTLDGVPAVTWVTDRPERMAGHISPEALLTLWDEGEDSFSDDPPNAIVTFLDSPDEDGSSAVLTLESASLVDGSLSFEVQVIEGALPAGEFGPTSLFIDSFFGKLGKFFEKVGASLVNDAKQVGCKLPGIGGVVGIVASKAC